MISTICLQQLSFVDMRYFQKRTNLDSLNEVKEVAASLLHAEQADHQVKCVRISYERVRANGVLNHL